MKSKALGLIVAVAFLLVTGCNFNSPARIYGSFYKALQDKNGEIAWQYIDKGSQQDFNNTAFFFNQMGDAQVNSAKQAWILVVNQHGARGLPEPEELAETVIEGNEAQLHFSNHRIIHLKKENGEWKILATATSDN